MGPKLPERHHHRQGGTDRPAFPFGELLQHFALLTLHVMGLTTMLGVVEKDDAPTHPHLIAWSHAEAPTQWGQSCHGGLPFGPGRRRQR